MKKNSAEATRNLLQSNLHTNIIGAVAKSDLHSPFSKEFIVMNIREIKNGEFDKVFEILKDSFPKEEYRTYEEQKKLLDNPFYTIYVLPNFLSVGAIKS